MQLNAQRALLPPGLPQLQEERETKEAAKDPERAKARKAKEKERAGGTMVEMWSRAGR